MSQETALVVQPESQPPAARKSALTAMASRLNLEPEKMMQTLKATVFKGASDPEIAALVIVSNEYGLNPFTKEIYAFPAKGGGIVPILSVDGWIKQLNRHPDFDGIEFECEEKDGKPYSVTATVFHKKRGHPLRLTEYLAECQRPTDPWRQSPRRMLRHKALIQAARVAFGFAGIYDEDEGRDYADTERVEKAAAGRQVYSTAPVIPPRALPEPTEEPAPAQPPTVEPAFSLDGEAPDEHSEAVARFEQAAVGRTPEELLNLCVKHGHAGEDVPAWEELVADADPQARALVAHLASVAEEVAGKEPVKRKRGGK